MPRSYRGIFAALVGLVFAAASPPGQPRQNDQRQERASVERTLRDIAAALQDANKPDNTTKPCPTQQEDRSSDLCAQWKAADAAEASAYWTQATFWLEIGGLVVGLLTLVAAAAAAKFARDAALHTNTANEIATDTNQRQLRGYLTTSDVGFSGIKTERATACFDLNLVNCGQTPVLNLRGHIVAYIAPWEDKPKLQTKVALKKRKPQNVGMNRTVGAFDRPFPITHAQREDYRRKRSALFIVASHTYEDVFGNSYRLDQIFRSRGPDEGQSVDPLLDRETLISAAPKA